MKCNSNTNVDPRNVKLRGKLFYLRKEHESGDPLKTDYRVCLNAYLTSLGIGYESMRTVKKSCFSELDARNKKTWDV